MGTLLIRLALLIGLASASQAAIFDLKFDLLTRHLSGLSAAERAQVDRSIDLIKRGEHTRALAVLSELNKTTGNAGIKVVTAYALLNIGDKVGAFGEAKQAESTAGDGYVCLFLARVAIVTGDNATCKRELEHVKKSGQHREEVAQIERELASKTGEPRTK